MYLHVSETDEQGNPVTGGLFAVDVDGGTPRRPSPDVSGPGCSRFSLDGNQILFNRGESGQSSSSLWVVPLGGGEPSELFDVPSNAMHSTPTGRLTGPRSCSNTSSLAGTERVARCQHRRLGHAHDLEGPEPHVR